MLSVCHSRSIRNALASVQTYQYLRHCYVRSITFSSPINKSARLQKHLFDPSYFKNFFDISSEDYTGKLTQVAAYRFYILPVLPNINLPLQACYIVRTDLKRKSVHWGMETINQTESSIVTPQINSVKTYMWRTYIMQNPVLADPYSILFSITSNDINIHGQSNLTQGKSRSDKS